jgi:hypothetical protein
VSLHQVVIYLVVIPVFNRLYSLKIIIMATDPVARMMVVGLCAVLLWMRAQPPDTCFVEQSNNASTTTTDTTSTMAVLTAGDIVGTARPGEFVATGDIGDPPGSYFLQADLAVLAHGNIEVTGKLIASEDVIVAGQSLSLFFTSLWDQISSVCATTCVHGMPAFLVDCACQCEEHWADGNDCSVHDCFDHGIFDVTTGFCVCQRAFTVESFCASQLCPNGTYTTAEDCITPDTVSTWCEDAGAVFPNCQITCASPIIDPVACPVRVNWGIDLLPNSSILQTGICGGGYTANPTSLMISALECDPDDMVACQEQWDAEAPFCCAPGARCTGARCDAEDSACCALLSIDRVACMQSGCAWCSDTVCAATGLADLDVDCEVMVTTTITGNWHTWDYSCAVDDPGNTICDTASRDTYLSIYSDECGGSDPFDGIYILDNTTTECLTNARAQINMAVWPHLQPYGTILSGPVQLFAHTWTKTCTLVLDQATRGVDVLTTLAVWRCATAQFKSRILLVPTMISPPTSELAGGTPVYIMSQDSTGGIYCLLDGPLNTTTAAQAIGDMQQSTAALFMRVSTVAPASYCGMFRLDLLSVGIRSMAWTQGLMLNSSNVHLNSWLDEAGIDITRYFPAVWGPIALSVTPTLI